MKRVVLTGSECTGKSTLAHQLAARSRAPRTAEYARDYALQVKRELTAADVEPIARGQLELLLAPLAANPPLVVHDTDLISTVLYARHYYGACPDWIVEAAREWRADLYLLCAPDLPWIPDGVRDRGGRRREMHEAFAAILAEFDCRVAPVEGRGEARGDCAEFAVAAMLKREG